MMKMKPVTNPMLVGAMELLKAENTPEHRKLVMEEIMHAKFLAPVIVDPVPVPDENGVSTITKDHKINLPMLTMADGKHFLMAFTDLAELQKWKNEEKQQIFGFEFKDYVNMLMAEGSVTSGIIINPFDHNLMIPKEMVENMVANSRKPTV